MLWMVIKNKVYLACDSDLFEYLKETYSTCGKRKFDNELIGKKVYDSELEFIHCAIDEVPDWRQLLNHLVDTTKVVALVLI